VLPNEALCVVGPSGCGKTTLPALPRRAHPAVRGPASYLDEQPVTAPDPRVVMVFQHFGLFPLEDRLRQTLHTVLKLRGVPRRQWEGADSGRVSSWSVLAGFEHLYPYQLSGRHAAARRPGSCARAETRKCC